MVVDTAGSSYYAVLSAWTENLSREMACGQAKLALSVTTGQTILLEVTSYYPSGGMLVFDVRLLFHVPNDEISGATEISSFPFSETIETEGALTTPDEPIQNCGYPPNSNSVWYRLTAPARGMITADTIGSSYGPVLSVWSDDFSQELACMGYSIALNVTQGQTILLEVADHDSTPGGGTLVLNVRFLLFPSNDEITDATEITTFPFSGVIETWDATINPSDPVQRCSAAPSANSVWYRLTVPTGGKITADTFGSSYNTVLSAWTSDLGTELACNDDAQGLQSKLDVFVSAGETIFLEVTGYSIPGGGILLMNVRLQLPPSNDEIAGATQIAAFPFSETNNVEAATTDPSDPTPSCASSPPPKNSNSVWYRLTIPADRTMIVDTFGSTYSTVLSAWSGDLSQELGCRRTQLVLSVTSEQTILLEVTNFYFPSEGEALTLGVRLLPTPANDAIANATQIMTFPFSETIQTEGATTVLGEPIQSCGNEPDSNSVWYRLTVPAQMALVVDTFGSSYNTVLSAWSSDLSMELACDYRYNAQGSLSQIVVFVRAGQTILLEVADYDAPRGGGTLRLNVMEGVPETLRGGLGNRIYTICVNKDGRYTAQTGGEHPVPSRNVLYGGERLSPSTSFNSYHSYTTGITYTQGLISGGRSLPVASSDLIGVTGVRTTYNLTSEDNLRIVQDVNVNGKTLSDSNIEVTTTITNTGTTTALIGLRYLWDYQIGKDDGLIFQAQNPDGPILIREVDFIAPTFDFHASEDNDFNDPTSPLYRVFGSVIGPAFIQPTPTVPTRFVYGCWPEASNTAFEYSIVINRDVATMSSLCRGFAGGDNANLYWWGHTPETALSIPPGESVTRRALIFAGEPNKPPPFTVSRVVLTPPTATRPILEDHTVTASVTNNEVPTDGIPIAFIVKGANPGTGECVTGSGGHCPFTYTGRIAGTDQIGATATGDFDGDGLSETLSALRVTATWIPAFALTVAVEGSGRVESQPENIACPDTCVASYPEGTEVTLTATESHGFEFTGWGGACTGTGACQVKMLSDQGVTATFCRFVLPDLLEEALSDPTGFFPEGTFEVKVGHSFVVQDIVVNQGVGTAGPSVSRFSLSLDPILGNGDDIAVGERSVPALSPHERSSTETRLTVPLTATPGRYPLGVCADAGEAIAEGEESNNCVFAQLILTVLPPNEPPDCTLAAASVGQLWPPNHTLIAIDIMGITDPDGDPVQVSITAITQDEPVNGLGDGDTSPDGFGIGTAQAKVRAERSGLENGRVYHIAVDAEDGKGGSCTRAVTVGVPHDQGEGRIPIDGGQQYDSTRP
jgi:hypothetical protein